MNNLGLIALGAILLLATASDIRSRRIPNWLVLVGVSTGMAWRTWAEGGAGALDSIEGMATGAALFLPFYVLRVTGAGDVKLMGAVGSFLGPQSMLGAALYALAAGGLLALLTCAWSGTLRLLARNLKLILVGGMLDLGVGQMPSLRVGAESVGTLPYALAITVGVAAWVMFGAGPGAG
jgi:prepilin peptidase CpaA